MPPEIDTGAKFEIASPEFHFGGRIWTIEFPSYFRSWSGGPVVPAILAAKVVRVPIAAIVAAQLVRLELGSGPPKAGSGYNARSERGALYFDLSKIHRG